MKSSAKNISLTSLDDLFSTEEERSKDVVGSIVNIPLSQLHDFPNHPFKVRDDEKMQETVESVKAYGVLVLAIVRQRPDGEYEIVAGHRRKRASELAGLNELPAIVRDLDDDAATIIMVDSNLQRENILPSERAQAYKMKLEAIKRQGERRDLTCSQVGNKLAGQKSLEKIAEDAGESKSQVHRYIRLTELQPELQEMVDSGKMAMTPAVELSYLKPKEQELLLETIESEQATPSLSQAQRIKKLSQSGDLNEDSILGIMSEQKKPELSSNITLSGDKLKKYFPKSYTPAQIENTIFKFEYLMFDEQKVKPKTIENRIQKGIPLHGNGWPGIRVRWCTGQLKTHLISKEVNRLKGELGAVNYVGIAADEAWRCAGEKYPLVEWGITEEMALQICYDHGFDFGGLYRIYRRASCWCCPFQRIGELRNLRKHHPELWARLRELDKRALAQFGPGPLGQFKQNWTVEQLEARFAAEDDQLSILEETKDV